MDDMTPQVRWELSERQRLQRERDQRNAKQGLGVLAGIAVLGVLWWLSSSGDGGDTSASASPTDRPVSSAPRSAAAAPAGGHSREVTSASITPWPFTVPSGTLRCRPGQQVTFETNGIEYGVNGLAQSKYPKPQPIWADDPQLGQGLKVDIGAMIEAGHALC